MIEISSIEYAFSKLNFEKAEKQTDTLKKEVCFHMSLWEIVTELFLRSHFLSESIWMTQSEQCTLVLIMELVTLFLLLTLWMVQKKSTDGNRSDIQ